MNKKPSILFMGTPDFAIPSLKALIDFKYNILGVITQPDAPSGRGNNYNQSPIKKKAIELGLSVIQPTKLSDTDLVEQIKKMAPDCIIVVAYGKIIPLSILKIPEFGCINLHASILPLYRGASPMQQALLNGDEKTGVTIMLMEKGLDTGPILGTSEYIINTEDTISDLEKNLSLLGAETLINIIEKYFAKQIFPTEQNHKKATYSKIIQKQDGEINWTQDSIKIYNTFRAYYIWPGVYSYLNEKRIKLLSIKPIDKKEKEYYLHNEENIPGKLLLKNKKLFASCGENTWIEILSVQPEGKKPMTASEFINGYKPINTNFKIRKPI